MRSNKISGSIAKTVKNRSDLLLELQGGGDRRSVLRYDSTIAFLSVAAIRGKNYSQSWDEDVSTWQPAGEVSGLNFADGVAGFQVANYGPGDEWINEYSLECSDLLWHRRLAMGRTLQAVGRWLLGSTWLWLLILFILVWIVEVLMRLPAHSVFGPG